MKKVSSKEKEAAAQKEEMQKSLEGMLGRLQEIKTSHEKQQKNALVAKLFSNIFMALVKVAYFWAIIHIIVEGVVKVINSFYA